MSRNQRIGLLAVAIVAIVVAVASGGGDDDEGGDAGRDPLVGKLTVEPS